jgi:hypothetical protein
MSLTVAASNDGRAMAIRDHVLPLVRKYGALADLEGKDATLRLIVLERHPWLFTHWTPFNALARTEASSPGYRHAIERQHARLDLPYGLEVWHERAKVLSLLWADSGASELVRFVRGAWEDAALALQPESLQG